MMKAMLSQPMAGKTEEEIKETRERAIQVLREKGYEIVNTLFTDEWYSKESMEVYENTSTETAELMSVAEERFRSLMGKKTFQMDVAKMGMDVEIGDIVGGRDYLTGMYMAKPVENIIYEIINDTELKTYKLEGEDEV